MLKSQNPDKRTPEQRTLAENFTKALADSGAKAAQIAELRDISEQAVSNWKRTGKIDKNHFGAISEVTGWTVDQLMGRVPAPDKDMAAKQKSDLANPQNRPSFQSNDHLGHTRIHEISGKNPQFRPDTQLFPHVAAMKWEQLMDAILKEGLEVLEGGLLVEILDDSMTPEFGPGDRVTIKRIPGYVFKAGDLVLFREAGGDFFIREYKAITTKVFEAVPKNSNNYGTMHSTRDGLEPIAKVMSATKMYAS